MATEEEGREKERRDTTLTIAKDALNALASRDPTSDSERLIDWFVLAMYEAGLTFARDPSFRTAEAWRRFVDESDAVLQKSSVALLFYPAQLVNRFVGIWEGGEWVALCRRRSGLEFFLDLYAGAPIAAFFPDLELDDMDSDLRCWGEHEGYLESQDVPASIPRSHWWWWYPAEPPP